MTKTYKIDEMLMNFFFLWLTQVLPGCIVQAAIESGQITLRPCQNTSVAAYDRHAILVSMRKGKVATPHSNFYRSVQVLPAFFTQLYAASSRTRNVIELDLHCLYRFVHLHDIDGFVVDLIHDVKLSQIGVDLKVCSPIVLPRWRSVWPVVRVCTRNVEGSLIKFQSERVQRRKRHAALQKVTVPQSEQKLILVLKSGLHDTVVANAEDGVVRRKQ